MMTVPKFVAKKAAQEKLCLLTAYDYPLAALLDGAGIDAILVGDSLGMVVQGHATTLPVTLDQLIYHAEIVGRAVQQALLIVDLPFPTFHLGKRKALAAAARVLKETRAQAVKLEGGSEQADVIRTLVEAGIPVMAHCGLRPQAVHQLGGFKVQRNEQAIMADALAAQEAGAFSVLLECIPAGLAEKITQELKVPTIGIGAGAACDGQILVTHDILGLTAGYSPRFVKQFADLRATITSAVHEYQREVRSGTFPAPDHSFK